MSALAGFFATWTRARATFGEGTPPGGSRFDQSGRLLGLRDAVTSAAPNSRWTGAASDSYAEAISAQSRSLGALADADSRLGAEVDRSAAVIAAGRRDLDAVRKWVADAASAAPTTAAGQRMLWPVIRKGSNDIQDIITRFNADLAAIAQRLRILGEEYDGLGKIEEGIGAEPMGIMGEGDEKKPMPATTLDLNDIVTKAPGELGDPGYMELIPKSGVWVPDPGSRFHQPTPVEAPLDYYDIEYYPSVPGMPKVLGPTGTMELVPGSGAWVPDPKAPGYRPHPPEAPVDLTEIHIVDPDALVPSTLVELWPRAGILMPDPRLGRPS